MYSDALINHACQLAAEAPADAILIYADTANAVLALEKTRHCRSLRTIIVTREGDPPLTDLGPYHFATVSVPDLPMTRWDQVKIALLISLVRGALKKSDKIILMVGIERSQDIDTIMFLDLATESEFITIAGSQIPDFGIQPEVFERALLIAAKIALEGREGKQIGAIFTLGDSQNVLSQARNLVLNPFFGYPREQRNIMDTDLEETIKEFSQIDGAFVIDGDGTIETAGSRLLASETPPDFPKGLGTRHAAAAAISYVSKAVSICISQSTSSITVYAAGTAIAEIEIPAARLRYGGNSEKEIRH